jgi:hypothetical protein
MTKRAFSNVNFVAFVIVLGTFSAIMGGLGIDPAEIAAKF